MSSKRIFLVCLLSTMLGVGVLLGLLSILDWYTYPSFHKVRLGMTWREIKDMFPMDSQHNEGDDVPNLRGGMTCIFRTRDSGNIVVVFDSKDRAVKKEMKPNSLSK